MEQSPANKILYDDGLLRLLEENSTYILEYLSSGGQPEHREVFDCKLCALRAVLLATVQLQGHCHCSPSVLRLEDEHTVKQFAGGLN